MVEAVRTGAPCDLPQIGYAPATANSADQRGGNVSYADQPGS